MRPLLSSSTTQSAIANFRGLLRDRRAIVATAVAFVLLIGAVALGLGQNGTREANVYGVFLIGALLVASLAVYAVTTWFWGRSTSRHGLKAAAKEQG